MQLLNEDPDFSPFGSPQRLATWTARPWRFKWAYRLNVLVALFRGDVRARSALMAMKYPHSVVALAHKRARGYVYVCPAWIRYLDDMHSQEPVYCSCDREGEDQPSWSVQTWEPMGPRSPHIPDSHTGKWITIAYPSLEEAMEAFFRTTVSSKARLTLGDAVGMVSDPEDVAICTLPSDVSSMMVNVHDRIYQRLLVQKASS